MLRVIVFLLLIHALIIIMRYFNIQEFYELLSSDLSQLHMLKLYGIDRLQKKAASERDPNAEFELGLLYLYGVIVEQDTGKAIQWLHQSSDKDYSGSIFLYGYCLEQGYVEECGIEDAIEWYTRAANLKNLAAQYKLAIYFYEKGTVSGNFRDCFKWSVNGALAGDRECQYLLGNLYDNGYGIDLCYEESFKWYVKSADQGHQAASYEVAMAYINGIGVAKNAKLGEEILKSLANADYERAKEAINKLGL
jgi:TPR repeat protein